MQSIGAGDGPLPSHHALATENIEDTTKMARRIRAIWCDTWQPRTLGRQGHVRRFSRRSTIWKFLFKVLTENRRGEPLDTTQDLPLAIFSSRFHQHCIELELGGPGVLWHDFLMSSPRRQ
jgi:hypothetical protein